ncbi:MAG: hypothetical protein K0S04_1084 [Herbinix sp.]|jgi:hypothetical protein|nr:hypothetical protein [Herbinix sp.]
MVDQQLPQIAVRSNRIQTIVNCGIPDKVPFIPTINNFYAIGYGITIQDAMTDNKCLIPALDQYLKQYYPDLVYAPTFFPIKPMEFAQYTNARWPGAYHNLPENTPYQYLDKEFLGDDEYDEYLKDPTAFLMKKMLSKRYKAFAGLEFLSIPAICGQAIYTLAPLAMPPVRMALENMIKTGELVMESLQDLATVTLHIINKGFPIFGGAVASNPFDDFADNIRGLLATTTDLLTEPELVKEAVDRWAEVSIPAAIANAKMQHSTSLFIPLHCGMDNFMSPANYDKYYWPPLKKLILSCVEADITPIIVCEGKYDTRFETLSDVPKGKVMYMFEDVDLKRAKEILGGIACIGGGMETQLLMKGSSKEKVEDAVKRTLELCAPGGGFFLTNTLALDNVEHEYLQTCVETLDKYGVY